MIESDTTERESEIVRRLRNTVGLTISDINYFHAERRILPGFYVK